MSKHNPDDDGDLFRQLMSDVKPLKTDDRIEPEKPRPSAKPRRSSPQESVTGGEYIERTHLSPVDPEESLQFSRPGCQRRQLQRLKRGDIPVEARLDLHGQTIAQAGDSLHAFLSEAVAADLRCVVVVHGKGQRSGEGKPILKSQVNHWLRETASVLAFSTAQARDGGAGAVYVLLRRAK